MEPVVHFRAAVALLGRFPALAGVDLDVTRGQIVLLRGPNGAGKTTLLRACAGLVPVVSGEAVVLGCDLRHRARAVRNRVGLLGHASGLYDDLTVDENLRFWGHATRAGSDDIAAALAALGLRGDLRRTPVARLSAGQQRRTSLACVLLRRPELWLLDEPHAGLDEESRNGVDAIVRQAVEAGATVLLSSHEVDRAGALADTTVEMAAGMTESRVGAAEQPSASTTPVGDAAGPPVSAAAPGSAGAPETASVA